MTAATKPAAGAIVVRPARGSDAAAVSIIHRSDVFAWKAWDAQGNARWAEYEALTALERWMNGGPWMEQDLCRAHLEHMIAPTRVAWWPNSRATSAPRPGWAVDRRRSGSVSTCRCSSPGAFGRPRTRQRVDARADRSARARVRVADRQQRVRAGFLHAFRIHPWKRWRSPSAIACENIRYTCEPCALAPAALPAGWGLALGGIGSAAQMWDRLDASERIAPDAGHPSIPLAFDLTARSGRERARLAFEPATHTPATASAYVWTPDGQLPARLWAALSDCGARAGVAEIDTWIDLERRAHVPAEARWATEIREVWGLSL
jgi:hypothetical protein